MHRFSDKAAFNESAISWYFLGMITNVDKQAGTTTGGLPKLGFELVDAMGAYVHCCAVGHNAVSTRICADIEVVLYHVTGRGPLGNVPGMLYLFQDALIVAVSKKNPPYVKRMQVEVKGGGWAKCLVCADVDRT